MEFREICDFDKKKKMWFLSPPPTPQKNCIILQLSIFSKMYP